MKLKATGVVLLIVALGGGGYWWFTRVDRAAKAVMLGPVYDADLEVLAAHGDHPAAAAAAFALVDHMGSSDCGPQRLAMLDAVYSAQRPPDATVPAKVLNFCAHLPAKKWGAFGGAEVAHGVRRVLREEFRGDDTDPLITWLEEVRVGVSEDVLVAVALALGTSAKAERYFETGFPASGQPLTSEPRVAPADDPRLPPALAEAVLQYGRLSPIGKRITPAIAKAAAVVRVPVTDEIIGAVARMDSEGLADAARAILGGTPPERVSDVIAARETWAIAAGRRAKILEALGASSSGEIEGIILSVAGLGDEYGSDSERMRQETIGRANAGLRTMGERAVPAARKYLSHSDARVRSMCLEFLFESDRPHFVEAVFEASPKLSYAELDRALELAGAADDKLLLHFAALAQPSLVEKVKPKLLEKSAAVLVPALFALMAKRESFSPEAVAAYQQLLIDCPGSGPATAKELDAALQRAGGKPEGVYWLAKLLGLKHLEHTGGGPAEKAVVAKFVSDTTGYDYVRIKYVGGKEVSREPTRVTFARLATDALKRFP